jgi:hypothetical protein
MTSSFSFLFTSSLSCLSARISTTLDFKEVVTKSTFRFTPTDVFDRVYYGVDLQVFPVVFSREVNLLGQVPTDGGALGGFLTLVFQRWKKAERGFCEKGLSIIGNAWIATDGLSAQAIHRKGLVYLQNRGWRS